MYCKNCGKDNGPGAAFCVGCGRPLQQEIIGQADGPTTIFVSPKKKNAAAIALGAISVVLAIALVLSMTGVFGASSGGAIASKSFGTPEDAINYFVDRFKAGDFEGALGACAVNEIAQGFDYKAYVERMNALLPLTVSYLPSDYKQYVLYNRTKTIQQISGQMMYFAVSFSINGDYKGIIDGQTIPLQDAKMPDGIIKQLDPSAISKLELVEIGKMGMHDNEQNRTNQKIMAKMYGADDVQFRTVLYKYGGNYYVGGFTVIEYGGRWLIQNMTDPLAGISAFGIPIPVSDIQAFEDMLG